MVNSLAGLVEGHLLGLGVNSASVVGFVLSLVSAVTVVVGGSSLRSAGVEGWAEAGVLLAVPSSTSESVSGALSSLVGSLVSSSAGAVGRGWLS